MDRNVAGQRAKSGGSGVASCVLGFIIIVAAAFGLLSAEKGLEQKGEEDASLAGALVEVAADVVDPANEGRLVLVTGSVEAGETLRDPDFGVEAQALVLERAVTMYQWREVRESAGRGMTCVYARGWYDEVVDSTRFRDRQGHENPSTIPLAGTRVFARDRNLGAFRLPGAVIDRLPTEFLRLDEAAVDKFPPRLFRGGTLAGGLWFVGGSPKEPQVGDLWVRFQVVRPGVVTVLAKQSGDSLVPFPRGEGRPPLLEVRRGRVTPAAIFGEAQKGRDGLVTGGRVLAWFVVSAGMLFILNGFAENTGRTLGCSGLAAALLLAGLLGAGLVAAVAALVRLV